MIDFAFVSFAFLAGIVAFFSPCSVVLLPGYIAHYMAKGEKSKLSWTNRFFKGLKFGLFTILGFFTLFGISGLLVIIFGQFVKKFIPWLAILFGIGLIIIGLLTLFGKHFSLNLSFIKIKNEKFSLYLFGIAYAVASLGCVFPIFLTIMLQSLVGNNFIEAIFPLLFYIVGISIVMLIVTVLLIFARDFVTKKLNKILPYVNYFSALILILAGSYLIYYQYILFRN